MTLGRFLKQNFDRSNHLLIFTRAHRSAEKAGSSPAESGWSIQQLGDFSLHELPPKVIESTQEFLQKADVDEFAIQISEVKEEGKHRRNSRTIVIWTFIPTTFVLTTWLLALLTLTGIGKAKFSEHIQAGILTAVTTSYLGLCITVVNDLFPKGRSRRLNSPDDLTAPPNS